MFRNIQYYDSADIMPIGRYMLATCRDIKYFAIGEPPTQINKKKLKKAVQKLNNSILKNKGQQRTINDINQLGIEEGKIYMHSSLVAVIEYANKLIEAGASSDLITEKLKPIQFLLIERGLTPDSKKNAQRLNKVARNFKIKSDSIMARLKNKAANKDDVYKNYLTNLITIEKFFGVKIDEQNDSINKYVLLIDQIKEHGDRLK